LNDRFDYALRRIWLGPTPEVWAHGLRVAETLRVTGAAGWTGEQIWRTWNTALEALLAPSQPGRLPSPALRACFFLAELEVAVRAGVHALRFHPVPEEDVGELEALLGVFPWQEFEPLDLRVVGPSFGWGTVLAGGADADVLVDDLLVDLKVLRRTSTQVGHLRQVVCYALLANRYGVDGVSGLSGSGPPVCAVGVYQARAGQMWCSDLDELVPPERAEDVLRALFGDVDLEAPSWGRNRRPVPGSSG
jgi:hypothetical protein